MWMCRLSSSFCFSIFVTVFLPLCFFPVLPERWYWQLVFPHKVLNVQETVASHFLCNISVGGVSGWRSYRICDRDWDFGDLYEKQFVFLCFAEAEKVWMKKLLMMITGSFFHQDIAVSTVWLRLWTFVACHTSCLVPVYIFTVNCEIKAENL